MLQFSEGRLGYHEILACGRTVFLRPVDLARGAGFALGKAGGACFPEREPCAPRQSHRTTKNRATASKYFMISKPSFRELKHSRSSPRQGFSRGIRTG